MGNGNDSVKQLGRSLGVNAGAEVLFTFYSGVWRGAGCGVLGTFRISERPRGPCDPFHFFFFSIPYMFRCWFVDIVYHMIINNKYTS